MKERPCPFNAPMVRSIDAGIKRMTRRGVKWRRLASGLNVSFSGLRAVETPIGWVLASDSRTSSEWRCEPTPCPYGKAGDRIWVREAWRAPLAYELTPPRDIPPGTPILYQADGTGSLPHFNTGRLRPPMFMPRWASRILLEVTRVRVERLQSCSRSDAIAEGLQRLPASGRYVVNKGDQYLGLASGDPREVYAWLWDSINGDGAWDANPWVWVVEFMRVEGGAA